MEIRYDGIQFSYVIDRESEDALEIIDQAKKYLRVP